jgi:hypothetical protein
MWPFLTASVVTAYLVSKAQDASVKCKFTYLHHGLLLHFLSSGSQTRPQARYTSCFVVYRVYAAEEWRNDPRNPYAPQLAKQNAAH